MGQVLARGDQRGVQGRAGRGGLLPAPRQQHRYNIALSDLCPFTEEIERPSKWVAHPCNEDGELCGENIEDWEDLPNPAPPLYIAAAEGHCELVRFLIEQGADPSKPAFDGATPFWVACSRGDLPMVQLLHTHGVDMEAADQDRTAPVHIAAAWGHLEVIKFLQQHGVDMEKTGSLYLDVTFQRALVSTTALKIAQHCERTEIVQFLHPVNAEAGAASQKRKRSELSMMERAKEAGVVERLKPVPPEVEHALKHGSPEERASAKKEKQKLQIHNQKIVARAEEARLKQQKLSFPAASLSC